MTSGIVYVFEEEIEEARVKIFIAPFRRVIKIAERG
jgi:hypothetical protein